MVHLHDAPGDFSERAEHLADAAFLGLAGGLVLVVDPFSLTSVTDLLALPRGPRTDPKTVLDGVIGALTETRGTAIPLAVVLCRADAHDDPAAPVLWLLGTEPSELR